jgi:5-methyltetrahydrofolate--homocysteine methyltransferase
MEAGLESLAHAVIEGNRKGAVDMVRRLLDSGILPARIIEEGLLAGMKVVGERFTHCELYVPEVLLSGRTMKASLEALRPALIPAGWEPVATMVLGTVQGDIHDIGKNLVGVMLEGAGIRVVDIGVDAPAEKFVAAVREHRARLVGISSLLTTTMENVPKVFRALETAGLRDKVRVVVGGAPVTAEWADEIGADAYAPDAGTAGEICRRLAEQTKPA